MKLCFVTVFAFLVILSSLGSARTWTDTKGRKIVADIVSADDQAVKVSKGKKAFDIPLANLSADDQEFVKEWIITNKEKQDELKAQKEKEKFMFDGKPLTFGGKKNVFEYEYSPKTLAGLKKFKAKDTGYKIGIAVPKDFDPEKPQKVFIVNTAVNNAQQGRDGNVGMLRFFAKTCVANGWICLAYDTNIGRSTHNADLNNAFYKLNQVWPEFKNWTFSVGGFSGGAKACFYPCAYLLKNNYNTVGVFLAGCNEDRSQAGRDVYKPKKSAYRDLKIFVSTGKKDGIVKPEHGVQLVASLKKNGMKNIRNINHDGKHSLEYSELEKALKWFAEPK